MRSHRYERIDKGGFHGVPGEQPAEDSFELDDTSAYAVEQEAEDQLDVMFSTEDIRWGMSSSSTAPGASETSGPSGVSLRIDASVLNSVHEDAAQKKEMLFTDLMAAVPVVLEDGTVRACLSHVMLDKVSQCVLGGLSTPSTYSLPTAIRLMQLMAKALAPAFEKAARMAVATDSEPQAELPQDENEARRERQMRRLTILGTQKQQLFDTLMLESRKVTLLLQEIKHYHQPPEVLVRVMVALFVMLDCKGFQEFLGPSKCEFPEDWRRLWKFTRGSIQLSERHPNNLLRLLRVATREKSVQSIDIKHIQVVVKFAASISDVKRDVVAKASSIAPMLLDWVDVAVKQAHLEIELCKEEQNFLAMVKKKKAKQAWSTLSSARLSTFVASGG
ncbi:hypothetical protein CYMTET_45783 [Cymbomonas tetramitiformis]|uniref:Uncharacterized protein n=1 Tax=Cymbomonas tetramitiformis TaxID=36881 RepID=A0AAE0BZC3_9CHLO|nr:hypothetical protein CYMTET_45783 [Cymbomonas tetramitiformis]